jgi:hypothetical protein
MTGEQLYNLYAQLQDQLQDCTEPDWYDLDAGDRVVWNRLAMELKEK